MAAFILGIIVGYFIHKFKAAIANLWTRTATKIEKKINEL